MKHRLIVADYLHSDCYTTARLSPSHSDPRQSIDFEADVIQHKTFDSDANSLYLAGRDVNPIAPIILPGDGLALLADFRDNDHKAGIVSKHERSPETALKLKWDNICLVFGQQQH